MQDQTFVHCRTRLRYTERLDGIARAQDELMASGGLAYADRERICTVEIAKAGSERRQLGHDILLVCALRKLCVLPGGQGRRWIRL